MPVVCRLNLIITCPVIKEKKGVCVLLFSITLYGCVFIIQGSEFIELGNEKRSPTVVCYTCRCT